MDEEARRHDDIIIGQLVARVEMLTSEVSTLRKQIEMINGRFNTGKGFFLGAVLFSSAVGASAAHFFEKLFK